MRAFFAGFFAPERSKEDIVHVGISMIEVPIKDTTSLDRNLLSCMRSVQKQKVLLLCTLTKLFPPLTIQYLISRETLFTAYRNP